MICDMIVGSGWPYGGEFLKKEEQTQMVTIETIDLKGGKTHRFKIQDLLDKVDVVRGTRIVEEDGSIRTIEHIHPVYVGSEKVSLRCQVSG